jgi:hypothetical protein
MEEFISDVSTPAEPVEAPPEPAAEVPPEVVEPELPPEVPPAEPFTDGEPPPPAAEPGVEPPVSVPAAPAEITPEEIIAGLRAQLEEVSGKLVAQPAAAAPAQASPDASGNPPAAQPDGALQPFAFLKDDAEFDEALKSADNFNKLLTGVVIKSMESMMQSVPQIVVRLADQQITTRSAINEFYENNKDLIPNKAFVGMVAQELAVKNPTWKLEDMLGKLGGEVRTRLRMANPGVVPTSVRQVIPVGGAQAPAFAGTGGGSKGKGGAQVSGLQKDINDLISDM